MISRKRGNGLKLHQRMFGLDITRNWLTERVCKDWERFLREVDESPPLEVIQRQRCGSEGQGLTPDLAELEKGWTQ